MIGIYKILNCRSGKCYIGQSKDIELRLQQHLYALRNNNHINKKLQEDFNSDGVNSFDFFEIEEVADDRELSIREHFHIEESNSIKNGYNRVMPKLHGEQILVQVKLDTALIEGIDEIIKNNNNDPLKQKMTKTSLISNFFRKLIIDIK